VESLFNWVKAGVGIKGNEMADRLAKKAALDDTGEIVYDNIPKETNSRREGEWDNQMAGVVDKLYKRSSM
jgi:hypothetical protein